MFRKIIKIILIMAGVVSLMLFIFAITVRVILPPNKIRALLVDIAQREIGREVKIGAASITIFGNIKLQDLTIFEKNSKDSFLKLEKFIFSVRLFPLFRREIMVNEISLISPEINITRKIDGSFNFSDIVENKGNQIQQPSKIPGGLVLALISELKVEDATLNFSDFSSRGQSLSLKNGDMRLNNISLLKPFSTEFSADIITDKIGVSVVLAGLTDIGRGVMTIESLRARSEGLTLRGSGEMRKHNLKAIKQLNYKLNFAVEEVDVSKIQHLAQKNIKLSPEPKINAIIKGDLHNAELSGSADFSSSEIIYADIFQKQPGIPASAEFNLRFSSKSIEITNLSLNLLPSKLMISGSIKESRKERHLNATIKADVRDLRTLAKFFPSTKVANPTGRAAAEITLSGTSDKIRTIANLTLNSFSFNNNLIKLNKGSLKFSGFIKDSSVHMLNGNVRFFAERVKLSNLKLLDSIAASLGDPTLRYTTFKKASGAFRLENGKVMLSEFKTNGGDKLDAEITGRANLLTEELNLAGNLRLAKNYSSAEFLKYQRDADGRVRVPFVISGNFESPKVTLEWDKILRKTAEEFLRKEGENILRMLLDRKQ